MAACLLSERVLAEASSADDLAAARRLFRAYADWLAVDLCFQDFERELATLPGAYAPPQGRLLLARVSGEAAGCVALRPLEPGICEMKRLWVEPGFAGFGLGRDLAETIIAGGARRGLPSACASTPCPRACRPRSISTARSASSRSRPTTTTRWMAW